MMKYRSLRKPIQDFLNKITEPPYSLTYEERYQFLQAIIEVYQQTTNREREDFLINDTLDLMLPYSEELKNIQNWCDLQDAHCCAVKEIENMAICLIRSACNYGVRLPESDLKQHGYENLEFIGADSFAAFVRDAYKWYDIRKTLHSGTNAAGRGNDTAAPSGTPTGAQEARNNAHSGTNAAGRGNDAAAPSGTPTEAQEARKKPGKRGRPQKEFEDFFNEPGEAAIIIPTLTRLLNGKSGKDAARIVVACCAGGWMHEPTPASIKREFGINEAGLKEPLRCHFHYHEQQTPKYKPFTFEEMNPIIERIRAGMEDNKTMPQPPQDAQK